MMSVPVTVLLGFIAVCHGRNIQIMDMSDNSDTESGELMSNPRHVAFSTYLSKDQNTLGSGQHIKFDKILLNDGSGYETSSGIFRAPVSGVYMFTFVVGERHHHEIRAKLVMDGKTQVGAIAEGVSVQHDAQGTNTVILHVCKGKPVWIEAVKGSHLEGDSSDFRYTTFSGVMLYARN